MNQKNPLAFICSAAAFFCIFYTLGIVVLISLSCAKRLGKMTESALAKFSQRRGKIGIGKKKCRKCWRNWGPGLQSDRLVTHQASCPSSWFRFRAAVSSGASGSLHTAPDPMLSLATTVNRNKTKRKIKLKYHIGQCSYRRFLSLHRLYVLTFSTIVWFHLFLTFMWKASYTVYSFVSGKCKFAYS